MYMYRSPLLLFFTDGTFAWCIYDGVVIANRADGGENCGLRALRILTAVMVSCLQRSDLLNKRVIYVSSSSLSEVECVPIISHQCDSFLQAQGKIRLSRVLI
jgi:hypothetical protein